MITPYYGEFLHVPFPLELSLNYCSHKCAYCFANLNKPDRKANINQIMRFLADFQDRQTLEAHLMREKYPVLISNRVDPFAASNYQLSLPIIETLTRLEIPVAFQTRGGFGVDEVLSYLPKSFWYVSVTMLDDSLRKKIEPGAPTIESRFQLIEKIRSKGHVVQVAINPLVREWLPDFKPLIDRAWDAGAEMFIAEPLHLNTDQIANMSEREKENIGNDVLKSARKRKQTEEREYANDALLYAESKGMHPYSFKLGRRSKLPDIYRSVYPKTFPLLQDFTNLCFDNGYDAEDVLTFEDFCSVLLPRLPKGEFRLRDYVGATLKTEIRGKKFPPKLTFKQLLSIVWNEPMMKANPTCLPQFAYVADSIINAETQKKEYEFYEDDNGNSYFAFNANGWAEPFATMPI
jgi:DNA repair photolyase